MGNISVFERVEKKYQMDKEQYRAFLEGAADKIHMDEYGRHTIRNIYYDTTDYELIRHSLDKPKYKEKLRLRGYGEITEESTVFLEIKKKYKGVVYKRRTPLSLGEAKRYLEDGILPQNCDQIMREIDYFMGFYRPEPKLYLAYDREAYVGNEDEDLRITIDEHIRSRRTDGIELGADEGCRMLNAGRYLMEIKVPMAYPIWLARLLSELRIYPVSFSKYGAVYSEAVLSENRNKSENRQKSEEKKLCLQVYSAV